MSYLKDMKNMFQYALSIEQFGSKQMAEVTHQDGTIVLYSYRTRVGRKIGNTWYLTTTKYSRTTSKQLNQFARTVDSVEWVDDLDNIRN